MIGRLLCKIGWHLPPLKEAQPGGHGMCRRKECKTEFVVAGPSLRRPSPMWEPRRTYND